MKDKRQMVPVAGLLATLVAAAYMVQLSGQTPTPSADFTNAVVADVQDAQGRVVLSGRFQVVDEDDDDVERKATLAPTGVDADATGEAEVEFSKDAPANQEVEFSIRNVSPNTAFTFVIDGTPVATATADGRGRAEVEVEVRMPGTPASR
jgi:hypothetical protein